MENPWQTFSIKEIYDNPWIKVTHHEVLNPSGQQGIYGKVHFKNMALGIIPLDKDLNTWLVGQYRYTLNAYSWEIPEGGGLLDQDPMESAQRELQEETGITASKWTKLMDFHTSNSVTDECGIIYLAEGLTFGKSSPEPTEELIIKKLPFAEAYEMVLNGEITDLMSVAGILRVKLWLGQ